MKILIDGMGGDNAPAEIVKGAVKAAKETDAIIGIIGPKATIKKFLRKNLWKGDNIEIIDSSEVIENTESPAMAVRRKKDSTIVVGMNLLAEGKADALISAGSTGALYAAGLVYLGRIKGIRRPAIAAWIPKLGKEDSTLLMDCGANIETKPENLLQYGIMGSLFVKGVKNIDYPIVKLLNVGAEEGKGDELHKQAFDLLKTSNVNFDGNIEGRDVIYGDCDVVVTDGFSGNVYLKGIEGMSMGLIRLMKEKLGEGAVAKAGALLANNKLKEIKEELDYNYVGGAPILGLKGAVLKIHGSSKANAVYHAILKAVPYVEHDVTGMIEIAVEDWRDEEAEEYNL